MKAAMNSIMSGLKKIKDSYALKARDIMMLLNPQTFYHYMEYDSNKEIKDIIDGHRELNTTSLFQFIKSASGKKKGVLLAFRQGTEIYIGWALCNLRVDEFDKDFGYILAYRRALASHKKNKISVPPSICKDYTKFIDRVKRYYKDIKIPDKFLNAVGNCKCYC